MIKKYLIIMTYILVSCNSSNDLESQKMYIKAYDYYIEKDLSKSLKYVEKALKHNERNFNVIMLKYNILLEINEFRTGVSFFSRLIDKNEQASMGFTKDQVKSIYLARSHFNFRLRLIDDALKDVEIVLSKNPNDTNILFKAASYNFLLHRYNKTNNILNLIYSLEDTISYSVLNLNVLTKLRLQEFDDGLYLLNNIDSYTFSKDKIGFLLSHKASILCAMDNYQEAIKIYFTLSNNPKYKGWAYTMLTIIYKNLGDQIYFEKYKELASEINADVLENALDPLGLNYYPNDEVRKTILEVFDKNENR